MVMRHAQIILTFYSCQRLLLLTSVMAGITIESEGESMMNVQELAEWVGRKVMVTFGDLTFCCIVRDAKTSYGNLRFLVAPECGSGETWVEAKRCKE